jgi:endonuclease YncB( thermonuclease family)
VVTCRIPEPGRGIKLLNARARSTPSLALDRASPAPQGTSALYDGSDSMDPVAREAATITDGTKQRRIGSRHPCCWFIVAAAILAMPAAAQTIVDGDTITLKGTTYRLYGIDAAEKEQYCTDGWAAGRAAIRHLRDLVQDREVACEAVAKSRNGATPALCTADGEDLGEAMVAAGMAWAFTRYSKDYIDEEAQANIDRLGVHDHDCTPAWNWRAHQRSR